jgi:hypothetical protein
MSILLILFLMAFLAISFSSLTFAVGMKKMRKIGEMGIDNVDTGPLVSIIVPACNEEKNIEKALLSLLVQKYHKVEIIVVNDRSTDGTMAILQKMKERYPRLILHDNDQLPEGWIGKSHALWAGAALAKGEYLIFTDADVVMEETTVARAVGYVRNNYLDHLTLIFRNVTRGWLLNCLILDSAIGLMVFFRPWLARKSGTGWFVGIGAFNMVKKSAYCAVGGHQAIKMHPIDDMMLGKTIKQHGFTQDCLLANDFVTIPWYDSVRAMINGLQKNMFALIHYRLLLIPMVLMAIIVPSILPVWGMIVGDTFVQVICLLTVAIRLATFYQGLRIQGLPGLYLPGALVTPYISCYIIVKSAYTTIKNRGIIWRGRRYDLAELKKTEPFF